MSEDNRPIFFAIENGEPFLPDDILSTIGNDHGTSDVPYEQITLGIITSVVAKAHYKIGGCEYRNFYRYCTWKAEEDRIVARFYGLIEDPNPSQRPEYAELMKHVKYGHSPRLA